jgi:hypothetical protein
MPKILPKYSDFDIESQRPFSKIKLIALDLDGTVLSSAKSYLPNSIEILAKSLKKAHQVTVTIATGRTASGTKEIVEQLPSKNITPIILYNGCIIVNPKYELLFKKVIPYSTYWEVIRACEEEKVKILAYAGQQGVLGKGEIQEFVIGLSNIDKPDQEYNGLDVTWNNWTDRNRILEPSTIVIHVNFNFETMERICRKLELIPNVDYSRGGEIYIEVVPKNCNKGSALEYITKEILKITPSEVLAIGDNDNDASMLKWAGIGVAISSGSMRAINSADYITNRGVIDGAIEVLNLVKAAKTYFKDNVCTP